MYDEERLNPRELPSDLVPLLINNSHPYPQGQRINLERTVTEQKSGLKSVQEKQAAELRRVQNEQAANIERAKQSARDAQNKR